MLVSFFDSYGWNFLLVGLLCNVLVRWRRCAGLLGYIVSWFRQQTRWLSNKAGPEGLFSKNIEPYDACMSGDSL